MPHSDRVQEILASRNLVKPGNAYIDAESLVKAINSNLPHATRAEALADRDGSYTALPHEMLPKIFGIDPAKEELSVIFELSDIYQDYVSTRADGKCQAAMNGDGRSFLVDIPTTRNGQKFRSARYISDDPNAVKKLSMDRVGRAVASVRTAVKMRTLTVQRQPELAGEVNSIFSAGLQEIGMLMAPVPEPAAALPEPVQVATSEPQTSPEEPQS